MARVLVDRDTIENMKKRLHAGRGREGQCYFLDENTIVKIFYYYDTNRRIYFDNRSNSQIAYPKDILIDKESGQITGYTMDYLRGHKFNFGFPKYMNIEDLKQAYFNLRLILLKEKDVYANDLCLDNMLYDFKEKRINIIDTSRWYYKHNGHMESICDLNFHLINALLISYNYNNDKITKTKYLQELYELYVRYYDYYRTIYKKSELNESMLALSNLFNEFLKEIETIVSVYKGEKVKTIKDITIFNYKK